MPRPAYPHADFANRQPGHVGRRPVAPGDGHLEYSTAVAQAIDLAPLDDRLRADEEVAAHALTGREQRRHKRRTAVQPIGEHQHAGGQVRQQRQRQRPLGFAVAPDRGRERIVQAELQQHARPQFRECRPAPAHTIEYDNRYRPTRITAAGVLDLKYQQPGGQDGYDAVGNLKFLTDAMRPAMSATFTYDNLDRLTGAAGGGWGALTYDYDALGNRVKQTHSGVETIYGGYADGGKNQLTKLDGQVAFVYDDNGNLWQDTSGTDLHTYTYTPTNMLETATVSGGTLYTYRYDADNQRVLKMGSGNATIYVHGLGEVLSEFEEIPGPAPAWTVDYVYAGSRLLAAVRPIPGLTVTKAGNGTGLVTGNGIDCGSTCWAACELQTAVTLTATPDAGSQFGGWGGACSGTATTTTVVVRGGLTCTATFIHPFTLTVSRTGTGGGSVSSTPAGLSCGATCSASYNPGTSVTLVPSPAAGSGFVGWSGDADCGDGVVTLDGDKSCTASFGLVATLASPIDSVTVPTLLPTYRWQAVAGTEAYDVWVSNDGQATTTRVTASAAGCASGTGTCAATLATPLALGLTRWAVRPWTQALGEGAWSADGWFTVGLSAPTLVSPGGGATVGTRQPSYAWQATSGAEEYYVQVVSGGQTFGQWFTAAVAGCPAGTGTCAATLTQTLALGLTHWQVKAWNTPIGHGPWSVEGVFTVSLPPPPALTAPTLVSPVGYATVSTAQPIYSWQPVSGAEDYYLIVWSGEAQVVGVWYTTAEAGCASGTGTCAATPAQTLTPGQKRWEVKAWSTALGHGPWSADGWFTVVLPSLTAPTLIAPINNVTVSSAQPTYSWQPVSGAEDYYLIVWSGATQVVGVWYTTAEAGCPGGTGTCAATPAQTLTAGQQRWEVKAWSTPLGHGPWSADGYFTVAFPPLTPPVLVSPIDYATVYTTQPAYTWQAVAGTEEYYLWVSNGGYAQGGWFTAAAANCPAGVGTCGVTPGFALQAGLVRWEVKPWNTPYGHGPWSADGWFTLVADVPPAVLSLAGVDPPHGGPTALARAAVHRPRSGGAPDRVTRVAWRGRLVVPCALVLAAVTLLGTPRRRRRAPPGPGHGRTPRFVGQGIPASARGRQAGALRRGHAGASEGVAPCRAAAMSNPPIAASRAARWPMRTGFIVVGMILALSPLALAQQPPDKPPDVAVCAPALRGYVRLHDHSAFLRGATVELLVGPQRTPLIRATTNRNGRFQIPGGLVKRGSQWLVRITGPGKNETLVKFTIDFTCAADPIIEVTPGQPGQAPEGGRP